MKAALDGGGIVDITTTGRRSGMPRRIEIYMHQIDGGYYLTGRPGPKRDWEANIEAHPEFTVHLKRDVVADVAVLGETEPSAEVRAPVLFKARTGSWGADPAEVRADMPLWLEHAPFVRFRPVDGG